MLYRVIWEACDSVAGLMRGDGELGDFRETLERFSRASDASPEFRRLFGGDHGAEALREVVGAVRWAMSRWPETGGWTQREIAAFAAGSLCHRGGRALSSRAREWLQPASGAASDGGGDE